MCPRPEGLARGSGPDDADRSSQQVLEEAAEPAFAELRNLLTAGQGTLAVARAELVPLAQVAARVRSAEEVPEELVRGALRALAQLEDVLGDTELAMERVTRMVRSLESATLSQGRTPLVSQIVEAAADLAHHATKLVGGVRWTGLEPGIRTSAPSTRAVPRLAAALATLATALGREGSAAGIDAAVEGEPEGGLRVHLTSPRSYDPSALAPFLQQAKGAVDVAPDGIRLDL